MYFYDYLSTLLNCWSIDINFIKILFLFYNDNSIESKNGNDNKRVKMTINTFKKYITTKQTSLSPMSTFSQNTPYQNFGNKEKDNYDASGTPISTDF